MFHFDTFSNQILWGQNGIQLNGGILLFLIIKPGRGVNIKNRSKSKNCVEGLCMNKTFNAKNRYVN